MAKFTAFVAKAVAFAGSAQGKRDIGQVVTAVSVIIAVLKQFKVV